MRGKDRVSGREAWAHRIIPAGAGKRALRARLWRGPRDHPRGCGEKTEAKGRFISTPGSSPRVRGKVASEYKVSLTCRIIPAGAGKSPHDPHCHVHPEDHPRGCGEKQKGYLVLVIREGSSPRVRGKVGEIKDTLRMVGIIPAGAGKRSLACCAPVADWDHPRGCGEKPPPIARPGPKPGSSPRVRGKASTKAQPSTPFRIIPAGAGKSCCVACCCWTCADHPRGCGEKPMSSVVASVRVGSSPRVRGKAGRSLPHLLRPGDHPRGCGEKDMSAREIEDEVGSSPRVRGKVVGQRLEEAEIGIIPAGAGKSGMDTPMPLPRRDHPRGCGEKSIASMALAKWPGSSPRVRGKALPDSLPLPDCRIIPAGAGKSPRCPG